MPGLKSIHSKSLYGLSDLKMNWNYGSRWTYEQGRQEVINRLATISQPLPSGVTPQISPESPTGEIYRYVLLMPRKTPSGREVYTLNDLKACTTRVMEREIHPRCRALWTCAVGAAQFGGIEIQPDPDRLRRYGITLPQLQAAISNSNATVGGDYVNQGQVAMTVRSVGLFGGGADPVTKVLGMKSPVAAAAMLRAEERRRVRDLRSLVIASVNNQPVPSRTWSKAGGRRPERRPKKESSSATRPDSDESVIGKPTRNESRARRLASRRWGHDEPDVVECIVLLHKTKIRSPR